MLWALLASLIINIIVVTAYIKLRHDGDIMAEAYKKDAATLGFKYGGP